MGHDGKPAIITLSPLDTSPLMRPMTIGVALFFRNQLQVRAAS